MSRSGIKVCSPLLHLVPSTWRTSANIRGVSAVAMGSVAQYRILGSAIGLAIVNAAFNSLVKDRLEVFLPSTEVDDLLRAPEGISAYTDVIQGAIRDAFGNGYNLQLKILAGLASLQIPAAMMIWKKEQIVT